MMDNLKFTTKLRVLILNGVKTMRTCSDYPFYVVVLEQLDILHRLHLEQVLVTQSSCRLTAASLLRAKDGKLNTGSFQYLAYSYGYLHTPVFQSRGTTGIID